MNLIAKRMLVVVIVLLTGACAHYPQQYGYHSGNSAYGSNYTIMHRNNYGGRAEHYANGNNDYYPGHHHHDQYNAQPRWENSYSGHQQHNRDLGQSYGYEGNNHRNDNDRDRRHFDRRDDD
jgi:hypothetical protein